MLYNFCLIKKNKKNYAIGKSLGNEWGEKRAARLPGVPGCIIVGVLSIDVKLYIQPVMYRGRQSLLSPFRLALLEGREYTRRRAVRDGNKVVGVSRN